MSKPHWQRQYPHLEIHRCSSCRSFSFLPEKDVQDETLYSYSYFVDGEYLDYPGHRRVHEANFGSLWRHVRPFLASQPRLFEIGCAFGFFVDFARRAGAEEAFGIDVSAAAIASARSHFGPHFSLSSERTRPNFPYNCVVAWDVWEHLPSPLDVFGEAIDGLERNGILALTTIDSSSWVARLRGSHWRQVHPPTHCHYPTMEGLRQGMKHLGLDVLHHSHYGYYRAFETYLAAMKMARFARPFSKLRTWPMRLNLRDEQFLIARKL